MHVPKSGPFRQNFQVISILNLTLNRSLTILKHRPNTIELSVTVRKTYYWYRAIGSTWWMNQFCRMKIQPPYPTRRLWFHGIDSGTFETPNGWKQRKDGLPYSSNPPIIDKGIARWVQKCQHFEPRWVNITTIHTAIYSEGIQSINQTRSVTQKHEHQNISSGSLCLVIHSTTIKRCSFAVYSLSLI